jgi:hypothetical protein
MTAASGRDLQERILVQQVLTFTLQQLLWRAGREAGRRSAMKNSICVPVKLPLTTFSQVYLRGRGD